MVTRVGRAVLLSVTVYGNPAPKIQWMHGKNPVQLDARITQLPNGTLKICDAENADTGKYTISAATRSQQVQPPWRSHAVVSWPY